MADAINTADAVAKDGGSPVVVGNPDMWQLLTKFVSSDKRLVKSTKAMAVYGGCLVQVSSKEGDAIAEDVCFVPGATVEPDVNGGRRLVQIVPW